MVKEIYVSLAWFWTESSMTSLGLLIYLVVQTEDVVVDADRLLDLEEA